MQITSQFRVLTLTACPWLHAKEKLINLSKWVLGVNKDTTVAILLHSVTYPHTFTKKGANYVE